MMCEASSNTPSKMLGVNSFSGSRRLNEASSNFSSQAFELDPWYGLREITTSWGVGLYRRTIWVATRVHNPEPRGNGRPVNASMTDDLPEL